MQPMSGSSNTRGRISTNWKQPAAASAYSTGVSLHSHTSFSEESLKFIHAMGVALPFMLKLTHYYEAKAMKNHGLKLDFDRANWRPPLQPRMAYDVEANQIAKLGLMPLVSITDHDTIDATLVLRTVPSTRHIPMSVEWSAPYGRTTFHLGIHNLPSADGAEWMSRMQAFTIKTERDGTTPATDAELLSMLHEMSSCPQILIVFNHPLWDLHQVGAVHVAEVKRFIAEIGTSIHAIELNGLRHSAENHEAALLAQHTGHLVISGGDRHGLEPNANINLSCATNFTDFVEEVRVERQSHVLFMDQYRNRWEQRILQSTLNAITDFPQFMPGWQRWDERAFHPDRDGVMRSFAELWPDGHAPRLMTFLIKTIRFTAPRGLGAPLSLAFPKVNDMGDMIGISAE